METVHRKESEGDFDALAMLLDEEYYDRFGEIALKYRPYNTLEGIEDFFIAYDAGKPVACMCLKRITDRIAELKRVYVLPDYRRRGIASLLLDDCESAARAKGYTRIRLETGAQMHEAIQLYKKREYSIIENYDEFAGDEICCCMEKKLEAEYLSDPPL